MYSKFLLLIILIFTLNSCKKNKPQEKWQHIEISPKDKSQLVTIITKGDKRYIMNGTHHKIPNDDYLLLDLSEVDRLGDGFSVCWNESNGYKWKIASSYAKLIENKLDSSKYLYYQPIKKNDLPISIEYKECNCGSLLIRENRKPWGDLVVEYR
ncbi:conserved hypothetical protein [Tenacibaculum litopenaei]|uniref:hypothetical protein n=1 Tax=Tenacibaculum litopenaei TaxID=396016 RepID=UPI003895D20E